MKWLWMMSAMLLLGLGVAPAAQAVHDDVVRCKSHDNRRNLCEANTRDGVRLLRQISRAACIEGETWGTSRRGIWVDHGCEGEFRLGRGGPGDRPRPPGPPGPPSGPGRPGAVIICEARTSGTTYCDVRTRGRVYLVRQLSRAPCLEGRTWGWDERGVWVSRGCRGEFATGTRRSWRPDRPRERIVTCESYRNRYRLCPVGPHRDVDLVAQLSNAPCVHGRSWGHDSRGIWVDRGCSGEFAVY